MSSLLSNVRTSDRTGGLSDLAASIDEEGNLAETKYVTAIVISFVLMGESSRKIG